MFDEKFVVERASDQIERDFLLKAAHIAESVINSGSVRCLFSGLLNQNDWFDDLGQVQIMNAEFDVNRKVPDTFCLCWIEETQVTKGFLQIN